MNCQRCMIFFMSGNSLEESDWILACFQRILFRVTFDGVEMDLSLDWTAGFALHDSTGRYQPRHLSDETEPGVIWRYKFSQLKGSSDDGRSTLTLVFQTSRGAVETREMTTPELQSLLFTMHAFLTAKVASVDPAFFKDTGSTSVSRGRSPSNPRSLVYSSGVGGSSGSAPKVPHLW